MNQFFTYFITYKSNNLNSKYDIYQTKYSYLIEQLKKEEITKYKTREIDRIFILSTSNTDEYFFSGVSIIHKPLFEMYNYIPKEVFIDNCKNEAKYRMSILKNEFDKWSDLIESGFIFKITEENKNEKTEVLFKEFEKWVNYKLFKRYPFKLKEAFL